MLKNVNYALLRSNVPYPQQLFWPISSTHRLTLKLTRLSLRTCNLRWKYKPNLFRLRNNIWVLVRTCFSPSTGTPNTWLEIPSKKKSAPAPLRPGSNIKQKKINRTWLTRSLLSYKKKPGTDTKHTKIKAPGAPRAGSGTKQKRLTAPGTKRYQATKFEVCQVTVKNV